MKWNMKTRHKEIWLKDRGGSLSGSFRLQTSEKGLKTRSQAQVVS